MTTTLPHTPVLTGRIAPDHPLWQDLVPDDSFGDDGVYWADLPRSIKWKWIVRQNNQEAAREFAVVKDMFKKDPLSPLAAYCKRYVISGFGVSLA
jgi:hypothetical protein